MNIHLPAILGFTRYQGFDPSPYMIYRYAMVISRYAKLSEGKWGKWLGYLW